VSVLSAVATAIAATHQLTLTITDSERSVHTLGERTASLEEWAQDFTTYEVGLKGEGGAFIPARFAPCPAARCNGSGRDCGGGRDHRLASNVIEMTALVYDYDGLSADAMARIIDDVRALGLFCFWYTTHGHTPPACCKLRLVFPFSAPMPLRGKRQWSGIAWRELMNALDLPQCDIACSNPDRVYFGPEKPTEDAERPAGVITGKLLDWRPIVGDALERSAAVAVERVEAARPDESKPVDLDRVRARLRRITKPAIAPVLLRRVLADKVPTPPPHRRAAGDLPRREAWKRVTVALANAADPADSSEALLEILRKSYKDEVREALDDNPATPWETIETLLEGARESVATYRAQKHAEEIERPPVS